MKRKRRTDAEVVHCDTVTLLHPYTPRARDWLHRCAPEHRSYIGASLVINSTSAADLAQDMRLAGMRVD